jgi:arginase
MELVADSGKLLSLDVVEVNPILDMKGATADAATKLIASGLGKNILPPELSPMRRPAKKGRR